MKTCIQILSFFLKQQGRRQSKTCLSFPALLKLPKQIPPSNELCFAQLLENWFLGKTNSDYQTISIKGILLSLENALVR